MKAIHYSHQARRSKERTMNTSTVTFTEVAQRVAAPGMPGMTNGAVRAWLRLEGLPALAARLAGFAAGGGARGVRRGPCGLRGERRQLAAGRPAAPAAGRVGGRLPGRTAGRSV